MHFNTIYKRSHWLFLVFTQCLRQLCRDLTGKIVLGLIRGCVTKDLFYNRNCQKHLFKNHKKFYKLQQNHRRCHSQYCKITIKVLIETCNHSFRSKLGHLSYYFFAKFSVKSLSTYTMLCEWHDGSICEWFLWWSVQNVILTKSVLVQLRILNKWSNCLINLRNNVRKR